MAGNLYKCTAQEQPHTSISWAGRRVKQKGKSLCMAVKGRCCSVTLSVVGLYSAFTFCNCTWYAAIINHGARFQDLYQFDCKI
ncbi:hypothetical protein ASPCADRAFT_210162 [Aspergillus carbonarius ITEM 5010]|uniref:Uncharacterized protein n=1 Tax=Aspergillus carbonarius (strain ITEM 5010) TaxID=602072 RepID=A0A1R3REP7_ASPC5|nr:hypothetical protein ASPCADRAFT_210162 [Aspergillus carbonarius ITEM 5010]